MKKEIFINKEKVEEIIESYPTPFHLYDEKGIRENARRLNKAFAWNKGFKEYFTRRRLWRRLLILYGTYVSRGY